MGERVHLRLSLGLVALFLATGLWLEAMFGLRAEGWIDAPLRREFLRLGHAHGGLLGLLNLALAWALHRLQTPEGWAKWIRAGAWVGAAVVGVGFFVGGLTHGPTDPGPTVLVVPAGALTLVMALAAATLLRGGPSQDGRE